MPVYVCKSCLFECLCHCQCVHFFQFKHTVWPFVCQLSCLFDAVCTWLKVGVMQVTEERQRGVWGWRGTRTTEQCSEWLPASWLPNTIHPQVRTLGRVMTVFTCILYWQVVLFLIRILFWINSLYGPTTLRTKHSIYQYAILINQPVLRIKQITKPLVVEGLSAVSERVLCTTRLVVRHY